MGTCFALVNPTNRTRHDLGKGGPFYRLYDMQSRRAGKPPFDRTWPLPSAARVARWFERGCIRCGWEVHDIHGYAREVGEDVVRWAGGARVYLTADTDDDESCDWPETGSRHRDDQGRPYVYCEVCREMVWQANKRAVGCKECRDPALRMNDFTMRCTPHDLIESNTRVKVRATGGVYMPTRDGWVLVRTEAPSEA